VSLTCPQLEEVAAELALGTVSGAERAAALDHLAGCPACRDLVDQLARVADSMLLLAPAAEPPPGFESKVLSRMGVAPAPTVRLGPAQPTVRPGPARAPRRRFLVGVAAAALVAGLAGAGVATLAGDGRPAAVQTAAGTPAAGVRTALAVDTDGRWTCRAVVYGDAPTWLVVSLDRTDGLSASFTVEAFHSDDPTPVSLGTFSTAQGHGTFAQPVPLPADSLQSVRVLDAAGRVRYQMNFERT
jgi:hypothetical protein